MDDRGDEIDRAMARLEELLHRPGAIEEGLARLGTDQVGPMLCWVVTAPDTELEEHGLELEEHDRLELVAWTLELARRAGR
jgi:hypothetical protein